MSKKYENLKPLEAKTENQKNYIHALNEKDIILVQGGAGVGKTMVTIGIACEWLSKQRVEKIVICRSSFQTSKTCGYSPGSYKEKSLDHFKQQSAYFEYFIGKSKFLELWKSGVIELSMVETIRGLSYNNTFMILEECQECLADDILLFQSRMGEGSTAVFLGDVEQSKHNNCPFERIFKELDDEDIAKIKFTSFDVLRHKKMRKIFDKMKRIIDG